MICVVMMNYSCDKTMVTEPNNIELPRTYNFVNSDFTGSLQCYNALGNQINYISPLFIKYDFLFYDGGTYPYQSISIKNDSSVLFNYTLKEITNSDNGMFSSHNDTLYFFYSTKSSHNLLFNGVFNDQKLLIPAYGYKLEYVSAVKTGYTGTTGFGYPDIPGLLKKLKDGDYGRLYVQQFYLVYEKAPE